MDTAQIAIMAAEARSRADQAQALATSAALEAREHGNLLRDIDWRIRGIEAMAVRTDGLGREIESRLKSIEDRWAAIRSWGKWVALLLAAVSIRLASLPSEQWGEVIAQIVRAFLHAS